MNDTLNGWIWFFVVMVFLFNGEPDIWDALHVIIIKAAGF